MDTKYTYMKYTYTNILYTYKVPVPNKARYPYKAHLNYFALPNELAKRCHHQFMMSLNNDVMDAVQEYSSTDLGGSRANMFRTPRFGRI